MPGRWCQKESATGELRDTDTIAKPSALPGPWLWPGLAPQAEQILDKVASSAGPWLLLGTAITSTCRVQPVSLVVAHTWLDSSCSH